MELAPSPLYEHLQVGVHRKKNIRMEVTQQEGTDVLGVFECLFYEVSHETEHNLENAYYDSVRKIRTDDKRKLIADGNREAAERAKANQTRQFQIADVDAIIG